jgi:hypothetical protein
MTRKAQIEHNGSAFARGSDGGAELPARQLSAINRHNQQLFVDHLGCAQHYRWGYGKTERLGGLEVQDHLKFCRELHRKIAPPKSRLARWWIKLRRTRRGFAGCHRETGGDPSPPLGGGSERNALAPFSAVGKCGPRRSAMLAAPALSSASRRGRCHSPSSAPRRDHPGATLLAAGFDTLDKQNLLHEGTALPDDRTKSPASSPCASTPMGRSPCQSSSSSTPESIFPAWRAPFIENCRGFALKRKIKRARGSAASPNTVRQVRAQCRADSKGTNCARGHEPGEAL